MRHPGKSIALRVSLGILAATCGLTGCGAEGSNPNDLVVEIPDEAGMLRKVRSASEFEGLLKDALHEATPGVVSILSSGAAMPPSVDPSGYSGTYTAEAGVDEFDYARYDGSFLYVATNPFGASPQAAVRILRTGADGTATVVSSIPIPGLQQTLGLYVANDRLVVLTSETNYGSFGDVWLMYIPWAPSSLHIHVFDVSDRAHPANLLSAEIDGVVVASRRIDDRVILVTRYTPSVVMNPATLAAAQRASLDQLLPQITANGSKHALVEATNCYVTNEQAPAGYPVITTITSLSLRDPNDRASVCYNEAADGVYASTTALYVSQPAETAPGRQGTRIHRFALTGAVPNYTGSVEVPGFMWGGSQRDFRISEYQGLLRVMTTQYTNDFNDLSDHHLFVLRQKPAENALEIVAQLPNAARPEEIGKPNELLYGVRFTGDRAYVVTFRNSDPLYVLDLSAPADPRIAGTLEIPGFSDFLHPVTQNLLLGLGVANSQVKAELFDVSSLEHPQSRGTVLLGGKWSTSEAISERHAFAWLPGTLTDRFAIPASIATEAGGAMTTRTSLYQFEIAGKQDASGALLSLAGAVTPPADEDFFYVNRSFLDGDTVWYVRDGAVWSSQWSAPEQVHGPF